MSTHDAAVLARPGVIEFEQRPTPDIGPDDVLVKISHVGICGSDLHFFKDGRIGSAVLPGPRILGHEATGVVAAVGRDVAHLVPGDQVVVDPGQSCGGCVACQTGRYNLCERAAWDFLGTSRKDGALREYLAHPAGRVYRLPEGMSLLAGALLEPYAVATHGVRRSGMTGGGTAVVLGCGCIGLMAILSMRRRFQTRIIAADVVPGRLAKARELGADETIDSAKENLAERVLELTGGAGADYVFETAGVPQTVGAAADCARRGGRVVFVGMTVDSHVQMHFNAIMRKELDMSTVFRFAGELRMAVEENCLADAPFESVVSHRYAFKDAQASFENNLERKNEVIKTVITF